MSNKTLWLLLFAFIYWSYCVYAGVRASRLARSASDYFIAGRRMPVWVFVLAMTATSYSAWTFLGHPALIFREGFPYAFTSFYAIAIPLTGVFFLKRQWLLGTRFGYVTPGEMLSDYFQSDALRVLTVVVAILFSTVYLSVQFKAAGYVFGIVTEGTIPESIGMVILAVVVVTYVLAGGVRAAASVDSVHCVLMAFGIVFVGWIALDAIGGWQALTAKLARLATSGIDPAGASMGSSGDHSAFFAVPGVIQWTPGVHRGDPLASPWTGMMIFTFLIGMMGIQAAPAFSMWAFSTTNPAPFAPQMVWASAFGVGLLLFFFSACQGVAAPFLGASPSVSGAGLEAGTTVLPATVFENPDTLVPHYLNLLADNTPWLAGFLAVCALAAMQAVAVAYLTSAGGMLTRDLYKRYFSRGATHETQKLFGRLAVAALVVTAWLIARYSQDQLVMLGGIAIAFGLQMYPALLAVCWLPWLTRAGVTSGMVAGVVAVVLTDIPGQALLGDLLPWGRWPLTIYSAGWGILANAVVCVVVSALTQDARASAHRMKFHAFLGKHAAVPAARRRWRPLAWIALPTWMFFAFGPGATLGNKVFGAPNDPGDWLFGIPSIWAWQIMFWLLGVAVIWLLAYGLGMARVPQSEVEVLGRDIGDTSLPKPGV